MIELERDVRKRQGEEEKIYGRGRAEDSIKYHKKRRIRGHYEDKRDGGRIAVVVVAAVGSRCGGAGRDGGTALSLPYKCGCRETRKNMIAA
jgi:hypothetical protein